MDSPPYSSLDGVLEQLQRAEAAPSAEAALEELLEVWRAKRVVSIARLIERLNEALAQAREPIVAERVREREALWLETASDKEPLDLPRLMATPLTSRKQDVLKRLRCLRSWPAHPSLSGGLARWLLERPYSQSSNDVWEVLLELIVAKGDPRAIDAMRQKQRADAPNVEWLRKRLERSIHLLERKLPKTALDKEAEAVLERIEKRFTTKLAKEQLTEQALIDAIDRSQDDEPRLIYADWLSERNDPRGEFISLQIKKSQAELTDEEKKRERALLKAHAGRWLGPLEPLIESQSVVFERGFLAHGCGQVEERGRSAKDPRAASVAHGRVHRGVAAVLYAAGALYTPKPGAAFPRSKGGPADDRAPERE